VSFLGDEFITAHNLWLADDHLLVVSSSGFREYYKRFYLKDIQAISIRKTSGWIVAGIVWGLLLAVTSLLVVFAAKNEWPFAALLSFEIFMGIFSTLLLFNMARGPTCRCRLKTAVQTEHLYALNRIRTATVVVERLKGIIERAQIPLTVEESQGMETREMALSAAAEARVAVGASGVRDRPVRHCRGNAHLILFLFLIADFCDMLCKLLGTKGFYDWLSAVLFFGFMVCVIVSLILQSYSDLPRKLKTLTWSCAVYFVAAVLFFGVYTIARAAAVPDGLEVGSGMPQAGESGVMMVWYLVSALCSGLFGFIGLVWLNRFRKQEQIPPPVPGAGKTVSSNQ
jgi:hypothetical protein